MKNVCVTCTDVALTLHQACLARQSASVCHSETWDESFSSECIKPKFSDGQHGHRSCTI
jgi:hypothetical protein